MNKKSECFFIYKKIRMMTSLKKFITSSILCFLIFFFLRLLLQLLIRVSFDVYGFSLQGGKIIDTILLSLNINLISELPLVFIFFLILTMIQVIHLKVVSLKMRNQYFIAIILMFLLSYLSDLRDLKYLLNVFDSSFKKILEIQLATGFQFLTIILFVCLYVFFQFPHLKEYVDSK